jgi:hypothetical protein
MPRYGGDAFPKKERDEGRACMSALLGIDLGTSSVKVVVCWLEATAAPRPKIA